MSINSHGKQQSAYAERVGNEAQTKARRLHRISAESGERVKLLQAIDGALKCDKKFLKEHKLRIVYKEGSKDATITIPWQALYSDNWATVMISTDPEFKNAVETLIDDLRGNPT